MKFCYEFDAIENTYFTGARAPSTFRWCPALLPLGCMLVASLVPSSATSGRSAGYQRHAAKRKERRVPAKLVADEGTSQLPLAMVTVLPRL